MYKSLISDFLESLTDEDLKRRRNYNFAQRAINVIERDLEFERTPETKKAREMMLKHHDYEYMVKGFTQTRNF